MSEADKSAFTDYLKKKPPKAGLYLWRLPHRSIKDVVLVFTAKYRERGAGHEMVLSPEFDDWDGARVTLPTGSIEWAPYSAEGADNNGKRFLDVVGVVNAPCPFCKSKPRWMYKGRFVTASPIDAEYFWLSCCHWANVVHFYNPIKLTENRNVLLTKNAERGLL